MAASPADTFRQEAQDLFDQLEGALLDLEQSPADHALIDTAFRALHTIKGSGGMFGFDALARFAHRLEGAFDRVRKGGIAVSPGLVGLTLEAKDHLRGLLDGTSDEAAGAPLLARLDALVGDGPAGAAEVPAAARAAVPGPATWRIRFRLAANAMALGTNPLLLLDELRRLGPCTVVALTDAVPPLDRVDPTACYLGWDAVLTTDQPRSAIDEVFLFVLDDMELTVEALDGDGGTLRLGEILVARGDVAPALVDAALANQPRLGNLLVEAGGLSQDRLASALAEQQHIRQEAEAGHAAAKAAETIRVPAERLDSMMDRVGELVIAQARLHQLAVGSNDPHLKSVAEEIERLASELRETTMGIRMLPIGSLFGRYRRLVRDLSRDLGKEVALTTTGEETELDKTVIERLNDPLVHLIRNCADHGLEPPEVRQAAGKRRQGEIHLSAVHSGAQVLITVKDDGRGLDRGRIRARAEEAGLIAAGAKVADSDLFQCIFAPGFSTAAKVTDVSGRGVGMDVVKRTIEALRGSVEVASPPGRGTEVTLRLPLTLAIIDGLLVRIGDGRYVMPLAVVEECVELTAAADARSRGRSFLSIRGDLVPFLRLRELFASPLPPDPYQKVVIVSSGDSRVGLVVDQVIGDHQTVIKSLSKLHATVECFSGATILGDGSVALILDIPHLIDLGRVREERLAAS